MDCTIITVTLNAAKFIERNMDSIDKLVGVSYEHLIFDGGSNDETIKIVKASFNSRRILILGDDDGIYDAMNQSICMAKGKYIAILNADDYYSDESLLKSVQKCFELKKCGIVSTDISYKDDHAGEIVRVTSLQSFLRNYKLFYILGNQLPHPGVFVSAETYKRIGLYDKNMRISADYEFQVRALVRHKSGYHHLPINGTVQINGGASQKSLRAFVIGKKEIAISLFRHVSINPIIIGFSIFFNLIKKSIQIRNAKNQALNDSC